MEKKKDVVIRIDGKARKPVEKHIDEETAAASENKQETVWTFGSEDKNDDEKSKVVDMLRKRKIKEEQRLPYWDDGKRDGSPKLPPSHRKKKKPPFNQFSLHFLKNAAVLSVLSAVLIGSLFGMVVLSFFSGPEGSSSGPAEFAGSTGLPATQNADAAETEGQQSFQLPDFSTYVVQAGAFSTGEKGREMQAAFHSDDIPSVMIKEDDTHFLFIGMAGDKEQVLELAEKYNARGFDTYVKTWHAAEGSPAAEEAFHLFAEAALSWTAEAASLSSSALTGEMITEDDLESLASKGDLWQSSYETLQESGGPYVQNAEEWLNASAPAMEIYRAGIGQASFAAELQQAAMDSAAFYKEIFTAAEKGEKY